jgi:hypothetical protein
VTINLVLFNTVQGESVVPVVALTTLAMVGQANRSAERGEQAKAHMFIFLILTGVNNYQHSVIINVLWGDLAARHTKKGGILTLSKFVTEFLRFTLAANVLPSL